MIYDVVVVGTCITVLQLTHFWSGVETCPLFWDKQEFWDKQKLWGKVETLPSDGRISDYDNCFAPRGCCFGFYCVYVALRNFCGDVYPI